MEKLKKQTLIDKTTSPPEKYKDYKNRTVAKLLNRAKELDQAIKQSSLKQEDKLALRKEIFYKSYIK